MVRSQPAPTHEPARWETIFGEHTRVGLHWVPTLSTRQVILPHNASLSALLVQDSAMLQLQRNVAADADVSDSTAPPLLLRQGHLVRTLATHPRPQLPGATCDFVEDKASPHQDLDEIRNGLTARETHDFLEFNRTTITKKQFKGYLFSTSFFMESMNDLYTS